MFSYIKLDVCALSNRVMESYLGLDSMHIWNMETFIDIYQGMHALCEVIADMPYVI
jgi:hypothetical protein